MRLATPYNATLPILAKSSTVPTALGKPFTLPNKGTQANAFQLNSPTQQRSGDLLDDAQKFTCEIVYKTVGCLTLATFWGVVAALGITGVGLVANSWNKNLLDGNCKEAFGDVAKDERPQVLNQTSPMDPKLLDKLTCAKSKGFLNQVTPDKSTDFLKQLLEKTPTYIAQRIEDTLRIQASKKLIP
jgi:hypothetical protein